MKGIVFDLDEDSIVGIDVDWYYFEVIIEIWMIGKKDEELIIDVEVIFFEYIMVWLVVERLMEVGNVISSERVVDVGLENYGLEIIEILIEI